MKGNIMAKWKWEHLSGAILWIVIFVLLGWLTGPVYADEPPPPPEGGINYTIQSPCADNETGLKGFCYAGYGTDGTFYLTFYQDGVLQFIRRVPLGQTDYEVVWVRDTYNSF